EIVLAAAGVEFDDPAEGAGPGAVGAGAADAGAGGFIAAGAGFAAALLLAGNLLADFLVERADGRRRGVGDILVGDAIDADGPLLFLDLADVRLLRQALHVRQPRGLAERDRLL